MQLVNPCNKNVLSEVEFLRFEPRGENIDSAGLARVEPVESKSTQIPVTPAANFRLVVTGIDGAFDGPVTAAGVSAEYDLVNAEGPLAIRVPMAPLDDFYRTTDLASPDTCTSLQIARYGATATLLPGSGRVLIIGGATVGGDGTLDYKRTIESYDPQTGLFEPVAELPFGGQRAFHTATLLADGRILVAGGEARIEQTRNSLKSALIVDARDLTKIQVSSTAALRDERTGHVAVKLADGRVLVAGGRALNPAAGQTTDHRYHSTVEIYDPERGLFIVPGGAGEMGSARHGHTGTLLKSGKDVFIAGGFNETGPVPRPEVIRVNGNELTTVTASAGMAAGPIYHAAALVEDGRVLVSGGYGSIADAEPNGALPQRPSASVEMWELKESTGLLVSTCGAQLQTARGFHTVTLSGRRAIFMGGRGMTGGTMDGAEVATLSTGASCFAALTTAKQMTDSRAQHSVVALDSGELLVVGGLTQTSSAPLWTSITGAELFSPAREL
ncbi:MAG: hypothetical protein IT384_26480 [Deltaproteobacteria bacterium]|nr:hypothetical protein [Deltaproteobacteria bacterium]